MFLDIVLSQSFLIWTGVISIIAISITISNFNNLKKQNRDYDLKLKDQQIAFQKIENDLKLNVQNMAIAEFEKFKANELDSYRKIIDSNSIEAAETSLREWRIENEERIRKDAITRSISVNLGKITEHLVPFGDQFKDFNPKDARFIGSPIDLIVFDGIADRKEQVKIYFIEVKTGSSALSETQRKIWLAIEEGRIFWKRINIKDFKSEG